MPSTLRLNRSFFLCFVILFGSGNRALHLCISTLLRHALLFRIDQLIAEEGYGEYFGHSFGHGVGVELHESPNASPSNEKILPAGAVISAEPGIYLPDRFGVRIEDVLILRSDGCENITLAPKKLLIL